MSSIVVLCRLFDGLSLLCYNEQDTRKVSPTWRQAVGAKTIQIRRKGMITLPAELRSRYGLNEGDVFTVEDLGDGTILLVPRVSQAVRLGDRVAKMMEGEGIGIEEILEALEEEREDYYRQHYSEP